MVPSTRPNYCHQCGSSVQSTAVFCSSCGTQLVDEPQVETPSYSGPQRDTFENWIQTYVSEGWEVESRLEDRAVLVDRDIGSIPLHVVLLIFTGGVGNLLYGWYRYSYDTTRIELSEDGTKQLLSSTRSHSQSDTDLSTVLGIVVGFILLPFVLMGLFAVASSSATGSFLVLLMLLLLGGVLGKELLSASDSGSQKPSLTTFGRSKTVSENAVDDPTSRCTECGMGVTNGVKRTYSDRFYIAGQAIKTYQEGENIYCRSCIESESSAVSTELDHNTTSTI
ncbi:zinc ribbon domain-containing protein [Natronocalculus amylovorans]|uniref:Zinc ribbon domain-containing protein n=1 Tax=Natronocalculus amylovorans TaxID=2917812 RepID=A0AAE3G013_9EURY|nr:zinc ribbon domain-containing protein [Natronocalculus amylovorans]MCL9818512.1 zinc ribbon domain-containing protein [Natronocalculus amylovorans]